MRAPLDAEPPPDDQRYGEERLRTETCRDEDRRPGQELAVRSGGEEDETQSACAWTQLTGDDQHDEGHDRRDGGEETEKWKEKEHDQKSRSDPGVTGGDVFDLAPDPLADAVAAAYYFSSDDFI